MLAQMKIKILCCVCLPTFLILGCGGGGSSGTSDNPASTLESKNSVPIQGKLAQNYVGGAQVWYDLLGPDGSGNYQRDPGEQDTLSEKNGSYSLVISEKEGLLISFGGTYLNSEGKELLASPMLAPKPLSSKGTFNITPITTLVAAEPSLKLSLEKLGDWNTDIASPDGASAPLLRLAKTVESLSGILGHGDEPIALNDVARLRSITIFANSLVALSAEELISSSSLRSASSSALEQIFADKSISRNLNISVRTQIQSSMEDLVNVIVSRIPSSGNVVESDVVASIEKVQSAAQASIQNELDQQVTVSLGGLGFEFDPIITKITLELKNDKLHMAAVVSDERPETLSYRWTTSPTTNLSNPFSVESSLDKYDNSTLTVILRVTDDTDTYTTEICAWDEKSNPTICDFLAN